MADLIIRDLYFFPSDPEPNLPEGMQRGPKLKKSLQELLLTGDQRVQLLSLRALLELKAEPDPEFLPGFIAAIESESPELRRMGMVLLRKVAPALSQKQVLATFTRGVEKKDSRFIGPLLSQLKNIPKENGMRALEVLADQLSSTPRVENLFLDSSQELPYFSDKIIYSLLAFLGAHHDSSSANMHPIQLLLGKTFDSHPELAVEAIRSHNPKIQRTATSLAFFVNAKSAEIAAALKEIHLKDPYLDSAAQIEGGVRIAAIAKNLPPGERENFLLQEFLGARKYFQSTIRKQFFELLQDPPHPDFLLAGLDTLSSNKKLTENDEIFLLEILFLNISRHGALDPAWSKKLSDLCTLKLSESRSNEVRALALLCLGVSAPDLFAATTQSGVFVDNAKLQEALLGRYRLYPHQIPKSCRLPEPVVLTLAQSDQDTIKQNIFSYA
jgi:hypothetical protein